MHAVRGLRYAAARPLTLVFLATVVALTTVWLSATPARAGEFKSFNPKYINGKCQDSPLDQDCYHFVATYARHRGCYNKVGAIIGVNPNTAFGKYMIKGANWYCPALPPDGRYHLYVYQSKPPCKVGLPFRKCPKG